MTTVIIVCAAGSLGDLLPPSPPADKAAARQDQIQHRQWGRGRPQPEK